MKLANKALLIAGALAASYALVAFDSVGVSNMANFNHAGNNTSAAKAPLPTSAGSATRAPSAPQLSQ